MDSLSSAEVIAIVEQLDSIPWPVQLAGLAAAVGPMGWVNSGHPRMYQTGYAKGMLTVTVIEGSQGEVRTVKGGLIATPKEQRRPEEVADAYARIVSDVKASRGKPRKVRGGGYRYAAWNLPSGGVVMIETRGAYLGLVYFTPQGEELFDGFHGM